mgnify:CR=1 FL=1
MPLEEYGLLTAYYGAFVTSALLPWVNGEAILVSLVALSDTDPTLLSVVATVGQMTGKSIMYFVGWRTGALPKASTSGRWQAVHRWFAQSRWRRWATILVSATLGLPPFYLVSILAGALKMGFGGFLVLGLIGRFLHFEGIALFPLLFKQPALP